MIIEKIVSFLCKLKALPRIILLWLYPLSVSRFFAYLCEAADLAFWKSDFLEIAIVFLVGLKLI